MDVCKLTETQVVAKLIATAKANGQSAPRVVVANRMQKANSKTRTVRFALIVTTNQELLIDALINESLTEENNYYFTGSDVNLQEGGMEVDYLFFEAKIMAKTI